MPYDALEVAVAAAANDNAEALQALRKYTRVIPAARTAVWTAAGPAARAWLRELPECAGLTPLSF
jgi:hypothetical protein